MAVVDCASSQHWGTASEGSSFTLQSPPCWTKDQSEGRGRAQGRETLPAKAKHAGVSALVSGRFRPWSALSVPLPPQHPTSLVCVCAASAIFSGLQHRDFAMLRCREHTLAANTLRDMMPDARDGRSSGHTLTALQCQCQCKCQRQRNRLNETRPPTPCSLGAGWSALVFAS